MFSLAGECSCTAQLQGTREPPENCEASRSVIGRTFSLARSGLPRAGFLFLPQFAEIAFSEGKLDKYLEAYQGLLLVLLMELPEDAASY